MLAYFKILMQKEHLHTRCTVMWYLTRIYGSVSGPYYKIPITSYR